MLLVNTKTIIYLCGYFIRAYIQNSNQHQIVYALANEIVNRLVGNANTLLSVHSGENSYNAEYKLLKSSSIIVDELFLIN
ncbi:hypothetical protein QNH48_16565 [Neobacillus sp. YX16]|uniref:hypothetical protein n=1 Tax=Neobacillus sp. YX16 TaxID=3047874 RepID=UPI0024C239A0|nr:hypothetical protein [Neobacillus sp. YX16]WHZ06209.1 hypothetical protein QNH48_16565 [Neobacillus sp. YX16]